MVCLLIVSSIDEFHVNCFIETSVLSIMLEKSFEQKKSANDGINRLSCMKGSSGKVASLVSGSIGRSHLPKSRENLEK